jgi:hypothetical protein
MEALGEYRLVVVEPLLDEGYRTYPLPTDRETVVGFTASPGTFCVGLIQLFLGYLPFLLFFLLLMYAFWFTLCRLRFSAADKVSAPESEGPR